MGVTNTQREHKDKLFVSLFKEKEELLALYNAVNGSNYDNPDDLIVNTIEDVIYLGMKNDVSFLFDSKMNLYEHQSSWNPNMPLRGLFYFAMLYKGYVSRNNMDIYSSRRLELPAPQYVIFYNGTKSEPDKQVLRLSDSFQQIQGEAALECVATVLNINLGRNRELMERCETLYGYSYLIAEIQANIKRKMSISEAIDRAVTACIEKGILAEYLNKHRAEVCTMIMTEYNKELHEQTLKMDGQAELLDFMTYLINMNRKEDLVRMVLDKEFREQLIHELDI